MSKYATSIPQLSRWTLMRNLKPLGSIPPEKIHCLKLKLYRQMGPVIRYPSANLVEIYSAEDVGTLLRADSRWPLRPVLPLLDLAIKRGHLEPSISHLNGSEWAEIRSKMQKIFLVPSAATQFYSQQLDVCNSFLSALSNHKAAHPTSNEKGRDSNEIVITDFRLWACRFAAESVGKILIGAEMNSFTEDPSSLGNRLCSTMDKLFTLTTRGFAMAPWSAMWETRLYKDWLHQHQESFKLVEELISGYGYPDSELRRKEDSERGASIKNKPHCFFSELMNKDDLSFKEAKLFAEELFIAGVESTGNALSFLVYHLARNPRVQQTLYKEIMCHMPDDGQVSASALSNLPYLKACVKESLRLSPPVTGTVRITTTDVRLSGHAVPQGFVVNTGSDVICHLEEYFHRPMEYIPERWLGEARSRIVPFSFIPFGHGARMCIGRRFAEQELMMAAMTMVRQFRIELVDSTLELDRILKVFYAPDKQLDIKLYRR